jgi:hypothetical protein
MARVKILELLEGRATAREQLLNLDGAIADANRILSDKKGDAQARISLKKCS